jgi:hypothetical protein
MQLNNDRHYCYATGLPCLVHVLDFLVPKLQIALGDLQGRKMYVHCTYFLVIEKFFSFSFSFYSLVLVFFSFPIFFSFSFS